MEKIKIITGKIGAGKTTFLKNYLKGRAKIVGVIQPVIDGERFFEDVVSYEKHQITAKDESEETFRLGRFIFNCSAFEWAKKRLESVLSEGFSTIVIDEYGPLEFENKGLEPIVSKIISHILKSDNQKLIIVIRDSLIEKFIKKFNLSAEDVEITKIESHSEKSQTD